MMPANLLNALHHRGVTLTLSPDSERLHYRAPPGVLSAADKALLHEHKTALLWLLDRQAEKAAILEYMDGYPRPEAEALAWDALEVDPAPKEPTDHAA